jgi:hypothetical protein
VGLRASTAPAFYRIGQDRAMDIVEDLAALRERAGASSAVCVLARPGDRPLIDQAIAELHMDHEPSVAGPRPPRRPFAHVDGDHAVAVAFLVSAGGEPLPVDLDAAPGHLVVVGDGAALDVVGPAVRAAADGRAAFVEALVALAHRSEDVVEDLADAAERGAAGTAGYRSAPERRVIGRMRTELFTLQALCLAQHRLLAPGGELSEELPRSARPRLRKAAAAYEAAGASAARSYALLGDVLAQQSAVVTERLTLVSTIFLPLTVATGFFGMNFGWMVRHIGTPAAFVALGILLPLVIAAVTLVLIRRLSYAE